MWGAMNKRDRQTLVNELRKALVRKHPVAFADTCVQYVVADIALAFSIDPDELYEQVTRKG